LSDFQSIAFDLHLVEPDLCARRMAAAIKCKPVSILVQLNFLAVQPLLVCA